MSGMNKEEYERAYAQAVKESRPYEEMIRSCTRRTDLLEKLTLPMMVAAIALFVIMIVKGSRPTVLLCFSLAAEGVMVLDTLSFFISRRLDFALAARLNAFKGRKLKAPRLDPPAEESETSVLFPTVAAILQLWYIPAAVLSVMMLKNGISSASSEEIRKSGSDLMAVCSSLVGFVPLTVPAFVCPLIFGLRAAMSLGERLLDRITEKEESSSEK